MADLEPEKEEENPTQLRSAAVEALQSAVREKDPDESDRLTRYALALIDRARAIRQGRRRAGSDGEGAAGPGERRSPREEDAAPPRQGLCSSRRGR